jgi:hypothetical protein
MLGKCQPYQFQLPKPKKEKTMQDWSLSEMENVSARNDI